MCMSKEAGKPTQPHQFCQVKWVKIQEAGGGISMYLQSMYVQYDYKKEKKAEIRNSLYYYSDIFIDIFKVLK